MTFAGNLTLPTLGEGQNGPQRNKCLRNSENRKKIFKKTTNFGGGQNDPQRNKWLRNSENRKKIFKKRTNLPHSPSFLLPLALLFTQFIEMLQNPLVVLKNPPFTTKSFNCRIMVKKTSKNPV